jgi:putative membrane protein insertion efficiency factor
MRLLRRIFQKALIFLVRAYQVIFRPIMPPVCRYEPSCSDYALEALRVHGPLRGVGLAIWRIARCHPFTAGGPDPVPPPKEDGASPARS